MAPEPPPLPTLEVPWLSHQGVGRLALLGLQARSGRRRLLIDLPHPQEFVACDAHVVDTEFLRMDALREEILDAVGGVGEADALPGDLAGNVS